MPKTKLQTVSAQRLERSFHFDMSAATADAPDALAVDYSRIPVLPVSGSTGRDGRGPFSYRIETVAASVLANAADIPVFLNHDAAGDAVGWIDHTASPLQGADGGWEWPVRYTPAGLEKLRTEAFRYTSPTLLILQDPSVTDRQAGEVVGILEVSLVNLPNLPLRSLNAAEGDSYTVQIPSISTKDETVTPDQLRALGLDPEGTHAPEAILAAITALAATAASATAAQASLTAITTAAGAPADAAPEAVIEAAANSRITAGVLVSKQAFDTAISERDVAVNALNAFKAEASEHAAVSAVDAAISAGKFVPATKEVLLKQARNDIENFNALVAATPVHPMLSAASNSVAIQNTKAQDAALPEATKEMLKALRIDPKFVS